MIQTIDYIYKKGSRQQNEDAYVINRERGIFAAIDGATGLGGLSGDVAAKIVKDNLQKDSNTTLKEKVQAGNTQLRNKTEQLTNQSLQNIPKHERSTCGLAAIQLNPYTLDYISYGDCMLILQYADYSIRIVTYDHLDVLDSKSIQRLHQMLEKEEATRKLELNKLPEEQIELIYKKNRSNLTPLLQENRNKLNTKEGYGIIDGSKESLEFMEYGSIPLINVQKILLLSDGLKMHNHRNDTTNKNGWELSANIAFRHGIKELFNQIMKIEVSDPACVEYPRLKQHDDKTGILISF
jgi:serine/threonine protein phosphatase PrpC